MRRSWSTSPARRNLLAEGRMLESDPRGWAVSSAPGFREGEAPAQGCTACLLMTEALSHCLRGLDFILQSRGSHGGF